MIKIIMHGCNGKMGQVITKIAEADSKVEIVAGVDQFQGVQNPYPVFSSHRRTFQQTRCLLSKFISNR